VRTIFILFFGKWPETQILIPDWTYFHCPCECRVKTGEGQHKIKIVQPTNLGSGVPSIQISPSAGG